MAKGKAQDLFISRAPWIMALLMRVFKLELDDTAAIRGNLDHESEGPADQKTRARPAPMRSEKTVFRWA